MFASNTSQASDASYIEDVFSTYLYTGNGSTQTITNGIDFSGKGGMVWIKCRSNPYNHVISDTVRGATQWLNPSTTDQSVFRSNYVTSFNSNGFSIGDSTDTNANFNTMTSWSFRKQPKFFDVVTYTGNGTNRTISHNLGSVPGCIIVKRTNTTADWQVYHRSLANTEYMVLNTTAAKATGTTRWNSTTPTSTVFSLGTDTTVNANGGTYVAYLFAHDAGGFGLTGADNVISCGSFTTDGSGNATVSLGWEPQFVLMKCATSSSYGDWYMLDSMRGWRMSDDQYLLANSANSEGPSTFGNPTSTGFFAAGRTFSETHIYIAIRRGPMKTPTSGTSVYENVAYTGNATTQRQIGSSALMDMALISNRSAGATGWTSYAHYVFDRLRGDKFALSTAFVNSESADWSTYFNSDMNAGWDTGSVANQNYLNASSQTFVSQIFKRAPGFFDVVCYTGTGGVRTVNHNLGVAPELMIIKCRSASTGWYVYSSGLTNTEYLELNTTAAKATSTSFWNSTSPTTSVFSLGTSASINTTNNTYVAYLFASCPGVSKIGSYTGNGTNQTINCGFTGGARFVLIKRTDSTGDWYVWDTARGIVTGNDPRLSLNSTAAEVTTDDTIDPDNSGFIVNQLAATNVNVNNATYIYLAIA